MKNLDGFSCEEWFHIKYNYWKTTIEWFSTTMLPNETTTVKELLTILGQEKDSRKSYISIYQNWKNTEFTKISNTNELKQYFNNTITWILCIKNNKWTYYDVATDQKKINFQFLHCTFHVDLQYIIVLLKKLKSQFIYIFQRYNFASQ